MRTETVIDAVDAAREAWGEYLERVASLKHELRQSHASGLTFELRRIEAYGALVGRDEGMGMSMEGWLDEIEQAAREETE